MNYAPAFLECMLTLDIEKARKLWSHVFPHLDAPISDEDVLIVLHIARTESPQLPLREKTYSRHWLAERDRRRTAAAVGIAVKAPHHRANRAIALREAMEDAVDRSWRAGIDLDKEAPEVKRRIIAARNKELGVR